MGTCWNCGTTVNLNLDNDETRCHDCGEKINYRCWNCGECGPKCEMDLIKVKIKRYIDKLHPDTNRITIKIARLIDKIKDKKYKRICPNNIPYTQAKTEIKNYLARMAGHRSKTVKDQERWVKRYEKIEEIPDGTLMTKTQARENGFKGGEWQTVLNLGVCTGKFKIEKKINKQLRQYDAFVKQSYTTPCPYFRNDNLLIKRCENRKCPNPIHPKDYVPDECPYCSYKKGKKKGKSYKLKTQITNVASCQFPSIDFRRVLNEKRSD